MRKTFAVLTLGLLVVTLSQCGADRTLATIEVIPGTDAVIAGDTVQFIAIGSFVHDPHPPVTRDMTYQVTWTTSTKDVATINSAGLATAVGVGTTTITANMKGEFGVVTGTATLTVDSGPRAGLPSLAVYKFGQGGGTVTSEPAGIDCGSGPGCTGFFVLDSSVTLTATPDAGSSFGGWSANCVPADQPVCTVTMTDNETVGAIFNK